MPPEPYEYQGPARSAAFLRDRKIARGTPLLVPTRANTQRAFGAYFPTPQTEMARLYGILVLTLEGAQISTMTWFSGNSAPSNFGLPPEFSNSGRPGHDPLNWACPRICVATRCPVMGN